MRLSLSIGNLLYQYSPLLYKHAYRLFKNMQDKHEIAFLRSNIKAGDVVLDIGANIGFYTNIIANCVGETGMVHSFEPDTSNFNYLRNNTREHKNVKLNNQAVGSVSGKIKIYTSNELNVDHRTYPVENFKSVYEIDAVAIDDYLSNNERVNFIKMDIQGFEIEALMGMKKLIQRCKPKILLEFWPHGIEASGNTVETYFKTLIELEYDIQLLENGVTQSLSLENISRFKGQAKELYYNIFLS